MLVLFKNNTLTAGLGGTDLTSNKRWFQRERRPWELLSCMLPFSALPEAADTQGGFPIWTAESSSPGGGSAAASFSKACSHLSVNPGDSLSCPETPLPCLTAHQTPQIQIFHAAQLRIFCFVLFFLPHLSFILKFSLCCFLKAYVTKAAFHPTFGLPEMFQSCFHVQKWKLPNPARRKHASSSSVRKK